MFMFFPIAMVYGQEDSLLVLKGKVVSESRGVPYATLQLQGTSIGVCCNDAGEFELKVPASHRNSCVLVRSVGYVQAVRSVASLLLNGRVRLERRSIELREVVVSDFHSARHLLLAAVERIEENYHQQVAYSTFFYRDWRAADGDLYLFDEAVMNVRRCAYSQYADKRSYQLNPTRREMASNFKSLLRHRLVVCDRDCLKRKIQSDDGVEQMLEYADNESFYDPVSTPQASYSLAKRMLMEQRFEPIRVFSSDGEDFYQVTSVGPNRRLGAKSRYRCTIRKSDLAIVALSSAQLPYCRRVPDDLLLNNYFNRMDYDADSSSWTYDVREGHYTLTHYYNFSSYTLSSNHPGHENAQQHWQRCTDWTLTDFSFLAPRVHGDSLEVKLQTLPGAFGNSDYNSDFWGHYNSIPIDSYPLQLLMNKFR